MLADSVTVGLQFPWSFPIICPICSLGSRFISPLPATLYISFFTLYSSIRISAPSSFWKIISPSYQKLKSEVFKSITPIVNVVNNRESPITVIEGNSISLPSLTACKPARASAGNGD
ncbi:palmitoyltransferase pfa3 [Gossypium arboreum]|uniref:Palmitoyltransferase pfa3 n=1 Tax=Gossypium arboreum TaxID=29729 RepID=A0A0B0Q2Z9_GOSAR|nr:palmitoyltransferase pfa3 [Gossypium arboreum]